VPRVDRSQRGQTSCGTHLSVSLGWAPHVPRRTPHRKKLRRALRGGRTPASVGFRVRATVSRDFGLYRTSVERRIQPGQRKDAGVAGDGRTARCRGGGSRVRTEMALQRAPARTRGARVIYGSGRTRWTRLRVLTVTGTRSPVSSCGGESGLREKRPLRARERKKKRGERRLGSPGGRTGVRW
jgi:hypothetical protein